MAYRYDPDLDFLSEVSSEDLDILVTYLTKDEDGKTRLTEELTGSEEYKTYYPDHCEYWDLIAAELQCFGANSFMTIFRGGKGVLYEEILTDVCDKLDVEYHKNDNVEEKEEHLLMKVLEGSLEKMSRSELKQIVKDLNLETTSFTPQAVTAAIQAGISVSGLLTYQVALIVANSIAKAILGSGLSIASNAGLTRVIGMFAGPIGWFITGLWTAIDIAGPAYRVTIPAVIQVAFLRAQYNYGDEAVENDNDSDESDDFEEDSFDEEEMVIKNCSVGSMGMSILSLTPQLFSQNFAGVLDMRREAQAYSTKLWDDDSKDMDDDKILHQMGAMHDAYSEFNIRHDEDMAIRHYLESAEYGNKDAIFALARMVYQKSINKEDGIHELIIQVCSALNNTPIEFVDIDDYLLIHNFVLPEIFISATIMRYLANEEYADAQYALGVICEQLTDNFDDFVFLNSDMQDRAYEVLGIEEVDPDPLENMEAISKKSLEWMNLAYRNGSKLAQVRAKLSTDSETVKRMIENWNPENHPISWNSSAPIDVKDPLQAATSDTSKKCPACGASIPNAASAKFCIECGAKLHRENKCPECSTIIPDGAKFCSECGAKLI